MDDKQATISNHRVNSNESNSATVLGKPNQCYICETKTQAIELHHILPQAFGGEEGPTAYLDANCHALLHKQALNIVSRTVEKQQYFPDAQIQRAIPLIRVIVRAILKQRNSPDFSLDGKLQIKINKGLISLLHMKKLDKGFKSLDAFINAILKDYLTREFPLLNEQINGMPHKPK